MTLPDIRYDLSVPDPHSHSVTVTLEVRRVKSSTVRLTMPVWTPGSYLVREFARHVSGFAAEGEGRPLFWRKVSKQTWEVETRRVGLLVVRYQVYAYELQVQTSCVDADHATLNGASLFLAVEGRTREPHLLVLHPLPGWKRVSTTLREIPSDVKGGDPHAVRVMADNYDELVDSPIEMGNHSMRTFSVRRVPHEVGIVGIGNFNTEKLVGDTARIVRAAVRVFGEIPYDRYLFLMQMHPQRGGGLEHAGSALMQFHRWKFEPRDEYRRALSLIAHEYFHCWNVKRLRPAMASERGGVEPFDYERENYTSLLWVAEGITSYYDELLLRWAGLATAEEYLETVARDYKDYLETPGRRLQSLEEASFDAWIKYYRPNENSRNTTISYYLKGGLVALALDLEVRRTSGGERSLSDLLRWLWRERARRGIPYTAADVAAAAAVAAGRSLRSFFRRHVAGTEELDLSRFLAYAGLELTPRRGGESTRGRSPYLGIEWKKENGRAIVSVVLADTPAMRGGLYVGDEIVALDGVRVDDATFGARLAERRPGERVTLLVARRELLRELRVALGERPATDWSIVRKGRATPAQQHLYERWLKAPWRAPDESQARKRLPAPRTAPGDDRHL